LPISKKAAKQSHNVLKKGVATSQVKPHPSSKNLKAKRSSRPLCLSLNKKNQHPPQVAVQSKNKRNEN